MNNNIYTKKFEFCPAAIVAPDDRPKNVSRVAFALGALADKYASLSRYEIHISAGKANKIKVEGYAWKTTLKVISFVLSFFILPAIALVAKTLYKNFCSNNIHLIAADQKNPNPEIPDDVDLPEMEPSEEKEDNLLEVDILNADEVQEEKKLHQRKTYHYDSFIKLMEVAEAYINKEKVRNKVRISIKLPDNADLTEKEMIDHWFKHYKGFIIGEKHTKNAPKAFLVDHMAYLKEQGVKVIFMEQLYDDQQEDLDVFLLDLPLSEKLFANVFRADSKDKFLPPYGYKGILEAAKREGIRVVAIDTKTANHFEKEKRWKTMNYFAYKIMKQTIRELKDDEKYVALMGCGHLNNRNQGRIPGVTTLLDSPCMIIDDKQKDDLIPIQFNASPYDEEIQADIYYLR